MKKKQNNSGNKQIEQNPEVEIKKVLSESDLKKKFIKKTIYLLLIVIAVVAYTDYKEYFVGDQNNNHIERKWRSYYRFTDEQKKSADIVVFGNSHASTGVEPYIVSMATGSYCFILNSLGSCVIDAYFNLQEILNHQDKPKIVILETSCLNNDEIGAEWGRIQSFEAKKGVWQKLKTMPFFFKPDEWLKAWSPSIRNHSFLLTDSARIAYNLENVGQSKNPDRTHFDLGRFSHGQNYLKDSTIARYTKEGPPFKSSEHEIGKLNVKYFKKLYELCKENGIELMLYTAPMYYKTFDNYASLKEKDLKLFKEIPNFKWFDLQDPYDSTLYTPEAFNNEFSGMQHNTYYGMTINSYKLSKYLLDNYSKILPNRQNDPEWMNDFMFTDFDFAYNHDVVTGMAAYSVVAKNQDINGYHVREFVTKDDGTNKTLILKIDNQATLKETVNAVIEIEVGNQRTITSIALSTRRDVFPPKHKVYLATLRRDVKVIGIKSIQ